MKIVGQAGNDVTPAPGSKKVSFTAGLFYCYKVVPPFRKR